MNTRSGRGNSMTTNTIPYREYPVDPHVFWVSAQSPLEPMYHRLNSLMRRNFIDAFAGRTDEFFKSFDNYLALANDYTYADFAKQGYQKIEGFLRGEGYSEKKLETTLDSLSSQYYANFQALEDLLFVGVDTSVETEKKWYPASLYTRSVEILTYLSTNGQLSNSLPEVLEKLKSKIASSIPKGLMPVIRLDPVSSEGGKPIFEAKIPQKSLDAGGGRPVALIPVAAYYIFADMLKTKGSKSMFRFETSSIIGTKAYNIATSPIFYGKVYSKSGFPNEEIFANLNRMVIGFDLTTIRYYAYNLEASFYDYGVISFRPEMLNTLKEIQFSDVDPSRHNINYPLLRAVYKTKIKNLTSTTAQLVTFENPNSYANLTDLKEVLLLKGDQLSNKDLYMLMNQNPQLFGNLEEEVEKRKRLQLKVLKDLKPVDLPDSNSERKELLDKLLKSGVVRITAKRKTSNSILDVYATNSPKVLTQTLGKDYIQKYETTRLRLIKAKQLLENQPQISRRDFEGLLVTYNIQDNIMAEMYDISLNPTMTTENLVPYFDRAIDTLLEKSRQRNISPINILYRNIHAEDQKELYGNVEASNLIAVEYKPFQA